MASHSCCIASILLAASGCLGDGGDDVASRAAALEAVTWTNVVGADAVADDLTKTDAATLWNAGASSVQSLDADGYAEFTTGERTTDKVVGLNHLDKNQGFRDIDFGIFLRANGRTAIREKGVDPVGSGFGPYQVGDVFRIDVTGGVVTYARNGVVFYTSLQVPSLPLVLDTSLRSPGATIQDARVVAAGGCSVWTQTLAQTHTPVPTLSLDSDGEWLAVANRGSSGISPYVAMYRWIDGAWAAVQQIVRPDPDDPFARSVAIDGSWMAVGTPDDDTFGTSEGSVRLYRFDGAQWVSGPRLAGCPESSGAEDVGESVAIQGNLLAVGSGIFTSAVPSGRVYLFRRGAGGWALEAMLQPPNSDIAMGFGSRVAIGGDRVFVSAPRRDAGANASAGAVFVYHYLTTAPDPTSPPTCAAPHAGKWVKEGSALVAPTPQAYDYFASDLDASASGALLFAGNAQVGQDNSPNGPGEAYVFALGPSGWALSQTLVGSGTVSGDNFCHAIALGGPDPANPSFAVVGTPFFGGGGAAPGAAHLFAFDGVTWTEVDRLGSPGALDPYQYGEEVTATADSALVVENGNFQSQYNKAAVHVHDVSTCTP
jgi:hypothetical protein